MQSWQITRKTIPASSPCNFSSRRVGTDESKPEVGFFCTWAMLGGKQPFPQGKAGKVHSRTENLEPLIVPCLMASPLQELIPDIEWGEGDDLIKISANRQDPSCAPSLLL